MLLLDAVRPGCLTWYVSVWWGYLAAVKVNSSPSSVPHVDGNVRGPGVHYWKWSVVPWVEAVRLSIIAKVNIVSVSSCVRIRLSAPHRVRLLRTNYQGLLVVVSREYFVAGWG